MVDIIEKESKGKMYKTLVIKTKYKWNKAQRVFEYDENNQKIVVQQGLKPDESLVVAKRFADGQSYQSQFGGNNYSCGVTYNGEDVSFWLDEDQHNVYKDLGGEGDEVKITCKGETYFDKRAGAEKTKEVLFFEKVE